MWEEWLIPGVVAFTYGGPINIVGEEAKIRSRNVVREIASWVGMPCLSHEVFVGVSFEPYEPWRDVNEVDEYPNALPSTGQ